jgi:hypothetical protein
MGGLVFCEAGVGLFANRPTIEMSTTSPLRIAETLLPSITATGNITISGAGSTLANEIRTAATFTSSGAGNKFGCVAAQKIVVQGSASNVTGSCSVTP